jgi:ligand-binding sensor domain-containing protein/putative methionine-R-sulfoxide reductase with GAF domain/anti-sigma regulatory factor (Ser/Thr protein kinase)
MWFGSYNGLNKHEGTSIKVYNKSGKDSTSLSSKEVHAVFVDKLGFVWAGTTGGLDKLDPIKGTVYHYNIKDTGKADEQIGYIVSIFQDDKDAIWVVTEAGIFVVNYTSGKYYKINDKQKNGQSIPDNGVLYKGTVKTSKGIWMFAAGYMIFYDFKSHQFIHQYNNPNNKAIFKLREGNNFDTKSELCIDKANNLYFIFNNSTLMKYNIVTDKLDSFPFAFPANAWSCCYSLAADYKGNVWIGFRYGGLLYFNHVSKTFTTIRYTGINSLIKSDYVYSLCEDYLKRMWVTTNNGIFIINYYDSIVQQKYLSEKKEFINVNYSAAIISQDDDGNIYAPFYAGGLFRYNVFSGNSKLYEVKNNATERYGYVYSGEKNKIYIGTKTSMLLADNFSGNIKFVTPKTKPFTLLATLPGSIAWVYKYNDNAVYFKKTNGIIYYFDGTDSLKKIASIGFSKQACISTDSTSLYYLTENGDIAKRNLVSLKTDTFLLYKKLRALNFAYTNTRDIADDGAGNIWVTSQNGLVKYTVQTKEVNIFTTSDGLLHDFCFTLCIDSKKRLWVGSMGGINLYDAKENIFINIFPEAADKQSNYFGSSLEAKDGHIYFLFGAKLVNINPNEFLNQTSVERLLQLNEVQVNGNTVNVSKNTLPNLSYKENRIYFRFGLLEFAEPKKVKYQYWLEGLDNNWVSLDNNSTVTFNALAPGKYILHVKAFDVYGKEVKNALAISFSIANPFWKQWWFIVCVLLLTGGIFFLIIKWRERNFKIIESGKTKLQKLTAEKYKTQFESEQISSFFSTSLLNKNDVDDVLWDVAKNLISKLGFVDCMIYLWNDDKTKMVQKAGYGPKGSLEELEEKHFDVLPGQGIVGAVMQSGETTLIADTTLDQRYRVDDIERMSELCVPIKYNEQLIGVIDSEHHEKNFFTKQHVQLLNTIATLVASKIKSIEAEQLLRKQNTQLANVNDQLAEVQLAALRGQMNPHFIFNALNSIKKFVIANEPANAEKYLGKFSKLIRSILDNSRTGMVTVEKELQLLRLYLDLEQLRFGAKLAYKIIVDKNIAVSDIDIPSMIVQPFVENAMLHGIMHREDGGKVDIHFVLHAEWLEISIEDNGVGRAKSATYKSDSSEAHQSIGIEVATKRLQALKKNEATPAGINIIDVLDDKEEGCGTKVIINIPIN